MKITPLKVLRIDANKTLRLSVAFQFSEKSPCTGSKKFPLGLESGKISRTQLQLSEEWKVWRTQLQLSEECRKQPSISAFLKTVMEKDDNAVKAMPLSNNIASRRIDEIISKHNLLTS
ncbi:hypothetical protein TNCV_4273501 [Trichonephila clavipes]|nr:hypothetical protein TNCV_4273501 [Trichonephila clavipes]